MTSLPIDVQYRVQLPPIMVIQVDEGIRILWGDRSPKALARDRFTGDLVEQMRDGSPVELCHRRLSLKVDSVATLVRTVLLSCHLSVLVSTTLLPISSWTSTTTREHQSTFPGRVRPMADWRSTGQCVTRSLGRLQVLDHLLVETHPSRSLLPWKP